MYSVSMFSSVARQGAEFDSQCMVTESVCEGHCQHCMVCLGLYTSVSIEHPSML